MGVFECSAMRRWQFSILIAGLARAARSPACTISRSSPPPALLPSAASFTTITSPTSRCAAARRGEHAAHFLHVGHRANPFGHHGRACFGQAIRQSRGTRGGWSTRSSVGQCVSTRSSFSATSVPMTPGPSISEWSACQLLPGLRPGGRQKRFAPWSPAGVAPEGLEF